MNVTFILDVDSFILKEFLSLSDLLDVFPNIMYSSRTSYPQYLE